MNMQNKGKTAVFSGSFDPITLGHLDIIERASKIFEEVVVVVMVNPDKSGMFNLDERTTLIRECTAAYENVKVDTYWGLLVDYMKARGYSVVVKGLRNTTDFNYEYDMDSANKHLWSDIETVFLMSERSKSYISSSMVKQVYNFKGELEGLVSKNVIVAMRNKSEGVE